MSEFASIFSLPETRRPANPITASKYELSAAGFVETGYTSSHLQRVSLIESLVSEDAAGNNSTDFTTSEICAGTTPKIAICTHNSECNATSIADFSKKIGKTGMTN